MCPKLSLSGSVCVLEAKGGEMLCQGVGVLLCMCNSEGSFFRVYILNSSTMSLKKPHIPQNEEGVEALV
jgi:hypothetical protein